MKVELAKMAGFCFGVNRAVDTVYEEAKQFSPVYTYGPIIHNETVIDDLEKKGAGHSFPGGSQRTYRGTIVIRSHGVTRREQEELTADGLRVVDATCPFVKRFISWYRSIRKRILCGDHRKRGSSGGAGNRRMVG